MCKKDIENLKNWTYKGIDDYSMIGRLSEQGKKDLQLLAKRLKAALNPLLNVDSKNKDSFLVRWKMAIDLLQIRVQYTLDLLVYSFLLLQNHVVQAVLSYLRTNCLELRLKVCKEMTSK